MPENQGEVSVEQLLYMCQCEVLASSTNKHYANNYRAAEVFYWSHIPFWIAQDFAQRFGARILDIGCAYGTLSLFATMISKGRVHCIDFVDYYLSSELVKKFAFDFRVSNFELEPLPWEGQFDLILFTEVLEHLNFNPVAALKKMASLLTPDGRLYLSTPDAGEWGRIDRYRTYRDMPDPTAGAPVQDAHIYLYQEYELRSIIDEAGLRVDRLKYAPGCGGRHFNLTLSRAL